MELTFKTGDLIFVYGDMDEDGFFMGELDGVRGLVPSNFLTEAPDLQGGLSSAQRNQSGTSAASAAAASAAAAANRNRNQGPGARGPPPPPRDNNNINMIGVGGSLRKGMSIFK